jgi:ABC-2 type transport system ATP-binding protein
MRSSRRSIASLVVAPPVLFLDEPTTGPDPRGRAEVWAEVRALAADATARECGVDHSPHPLPR